MVLESSKVMLVSTVVVLFSPYGGFQELGVSFWSNMQRTLAHSEIEAADPNFGKCPDSTRVPEGSE